MKTSSRIALMVTTIAVVGAFAVAPVYAESQWSIDHPHRAEVSERLKHQNKRITEEVRNGEISRTEAHNLRANDKAIRGEERQMAAQNGGRITMTEHQALNQQLNQNSVAIGR